MAKKTQTVRKKKKAGGAGAHPTPKQTTTAPSPARTSKTRKKITKREPAPTTTATPAEPTPTSINRRRFVRFPAMCRVDFEIGGRRTFGFTADLSSNGLFLKLSRASPKVGEELRFRLHLPGRKTPVTCEGSVVRVAPSGIGIEFSPDQADVTERVRKSIEEQFVRRLEENPASTLRDPLKAASLAGYYCEVRRFEEALAIYRRASEAHPGDLFLAENRCTVLLHRIEELGTDGMRLVPELEDALAKGQAIQPSATLAAVAERLRVFIDSQERARQEADQREVQKLREKLVNQAREEIKELLARKTEALEKERQSGIRQLEEERALAREAIAVKDREIQAEREELAAERAALEQGQAALTKREREIEALRENLDARDHELQAQERELATRAAEIGTAQDLRNELAVARDAEAGLEAKLRALRASHGDELAEQKQKAEHAEAEISRLRGRLEQASNKNERLGHEVEALRHRAEEQQGETAEQVRDLQEEQRAREAAFAKELAALSKQRDRLEEAHAELESRLAGAEKDRRDLCAAAEEARERAAKSCAELEDQRAAAERKLDELEGKLAELTESTERELAERTAVLAAREKEIEARGIKQNAELVARERALDRLQEQMSEQEELRERDRCQHEQEIEAVRSDLEEKRRELETVRDNQQRDLDARREALAQSEAELQARLEEAADRDGRVEDDREELERLAAEVEDLKETVARYEQELSDMAPASSSPVGMEGDGDQTRPLASLIESDEDEGEMIRTGSEMETLGLPPHLQIIDDREHVLEIREQEVERREEELLSRWKEMVQKQKVLQADRAVLEEHRRALERRREDIDEQSARIEAKLQTLEKWTELETQSIEATREGLAAKARAGASSSQEWPGDDLRLDPDGPLLSDQDLEDLGLLENE